MSKNALKNYNPMAILDPFRGKDFSGEWPTIPEMLNITVKRCADRNCFTEFDDKGERTTLTYAQAHENILRLAYWFSAHGIHHGEKVAVTGKNSPEWATVFLAALYAGATICPIDYALKCEEQENLLATAKPKFLFVDDEKYDWYETKPHDFEIYSLNKKHPDNYVYNLSVSEEEQKNITLDLPKEEDTAAILFTSGTTSIPKGVMLSHRNLISDAFIAQTNMIIDYHDVFYALLPIHHAYTMQAVFIESICIGAEIVFGKSLSVSKMMTDLKQGNITMMLGVPMLFNKLADGIEKAIKKKGALVYTLINIMRQISYLTKKIFGVNIGKALFKSVLKQANLYTIRIAISGGGPLSKSVFRFFNEMGIDFVQGYGLTETSPIITLNPVEHFKIESVGSYFAGHMQMKILDPNEDGVGEICVKGPMVMQGYYNLPEETAKVFTEDGWFKTGDLGWLDNENYLMLSGRAKNMIVTEGGKNVYPEEIEDMFQLESDIQQITVQGYIANEAKHSEELEALIYPADSTFEKLNLQREDSSTQDKVKSYMAEIVDKINRKLLPYQRITRITILDKPLEMTTTLKVKRHYNK